MTPPPMAVPAAVPERPLATIARNSLFLYAGEILSRAAAAGLALVLARRLGTTDTGKYIFVTSVYGIAMIAQEFGPTQYFVRSTVQEHRHQPEALFWPVAFFRVTISLVFAAGMCGYALIAVGDAPTRLLMLAAAASLPLLALGGAVAGALRVKERMGFEAFNRVLVAGLTLIGGGALVLLGLGLTSLAPVIIAVAAASLLFYATAPRRVVVLSRPRRVPWNEVRRVAVGMWPYFSLTLLTVTYFRLDSILVENILGPQALGEYGIAIRVMEVMLFVPFVLATAVFPAVSGSMIENLAAVAEQAGRALRLVTFVTVPMIVVASIAAVPLVQLVFGTGFSPAGRALAIVAWALVPMFAATVTNSVIAASRAPIVNTFVVLGMIAVNLAANLLVLPRWGIDGAAVVRVGTELMGFLAGSAFIAWRLIGLRYLSTAIKAGAVTLIAAVPLLLSHGEATIARLVLTLGMFVALNLLTGMISREDLTFVSTLTKRFAARRT